MFQTLHPLVIERSIHLLLSATKDGRMSVYVEPAKLNDNEEDAFVTPFRAQATPAELDAQLPAILAQWIASRQVANTSLAQQLADAEYIRSAVRVERFDEAVTQTSTLSGEIGISGATVQVPTEFFMGDLVLTLVPY